MKFFTTLFAGLMVVALVGTSVVAQNDDTTKSTEHVETSAE